MRLTLLRMKTTFNTKIKKRSNVPAWKLSKFECTNIWCAFNILVQLVPVI